MLPRAAVLSSWVASLMVGDAEIDVNAVYKLATNNYILGGGDGYSSLGGGNLLINAGNGNLMANDVIDYVIKSGGASVGVEGRILTHRAEGLLKRRCEVVDREVKRRRRLQK